MRGAIVLLLLALLGADVPPSGGAITGTVVVVKDGKPTKRADVYVYLETTPRPRRRSKLPGDGVHRQIRQEKVAFVPSVLVVPVGTEVAFPNYDKFEHNVFSPTAPPFDLGRYSGDRTGKSHVFQDTDEFDIYCDIHREMRATVKVVDSAQILAVPGGTFSFANVPPGTYKVVAWIADSPEVRSETVVVTAGGTAKLAADLHLQLSTRSGCHDRKDGTPYDKYATCPRAR
jgi:plastocyanin